MPPRARQRRGCGGTAVRIYPASRRGLGPGQGAGHRGGGLLPGGRRCKDAPQHLTRRGARDASPDAAGGAPGRSGGTAARTPHLAEAPLHRGLRGPLLVVAGAEQQPHGAQEADQEAPAAVHSRASRSSPGAPQKQRRGAGRASADEARAGRPRPRPTSRPSQARPRLAGLSEAATSPRNLRTCPGARAGRPGPPAGFLLRARG